MITFEKATSKDVKRLFDWRNEKETRANSFDSSLITWESHKKWFEQKIQSKDVEIFILFNVLKEPVGQIRLDIDREKNEAVISISIDSYHRQRGYASKGLKKVSEHVLQQEKLSKVVAYIKKDNMSSYKSFKKSGFSEVGETEINSQPCYILEVT